MYHGIGGGTAAGAVAAASGGTLAFTGSPVDTGWALFTAVALIVAGTGLFKLIPSLHRRRARRG